MRLYSGDLLENVGDVARVGCGDSLSRSSMVAERDSGMTDGGTARSLYELILISFAFFNYAMTKLFSLTEAGREHLVSTTQ